MLCTIFIHSLRTIRKLTSERSERVSFLILLNEWIIILQRIFHGVIFLFYWRKYMLGFLSLDIICSSKLTVFLELRSPQSVSRLGTECPRTNIRAYFCPKWRLYCLYRERISLLPLRHVLSVLPNVLQVQHQVNSKVTFEDMNVDL